MTLLGDIIMLCLVVAVPVTETVKSKSLNEPLTNMQVVNDILYIGGRNTIYALDKDLNIVSSASTCDTPQCGNINKVLLVDGTSGKLVFCGTGKGGICEVRPISNLSYVEMQSKNATNNDPYLVVSTKSSRPAVGMLTNDGNFMIAVTNGDGLAEKKSITRFLTYQYAISTRSVSTLYSTKSLNLQISDNYQHDYIIYYKKGFLYNGYSYFVTNQKKEVSDPSSKYESKLVRICQNDTDYYSYTDIVISCENGYNLIQDVVLTIRQGKPYLIGVFTQGEDPEKPSGDSVICGGSLDDIDRKVVEAKEYYILNSCNEKDNIKRYLPNNDGRSNCTSENVPLTDLTCENAFIGFTYVIGKNTFQMKTLNHVTAFDGIFTVLHGTLMNSRTVLLAGTSIGNLYMMNLNDTLEDSLEVFDQKSVGTEPIKAIHQVDDDTLYVMTTSKVEKYVTTDCTEFKTCHSVMEHRNPVCGWCVFQNRATRNNSALCPQDEWLQSFGSCVKLELDVKGVPAGNTEERFVEFKALHLPYRENDRYSCRFLDGQRVLGSPVATRNDITQNFSCEIPTNVSDHTEATLELVLNGISLASTPFLFYICEHYKRCGECVNKAGGARCYWNLQKPECTNSAPSSSISSKDGCPRLDDNTGLNFIPRNHTAKVKLKLSNLNQLMDFPNNKFWCYMGERGIPVLGNVDFENSTLTCSVKIDSDKVAKKRSKSIYQVWKFKGRQQRIG